MASSPRSKRTAAQNPPKGPRNAPTRGTMKVSTTPKVSYVRRRDCAKPTKLA
jgi:hypothetical protein